MKKIFLCILLFLFFTLYGCLVDNSEIKDPLPPQITEGKISNSKGSITFLNTTKTSIEFELVKTTNDEFIIDISYEKIISTSPSNSKNNLYYHQYEQSVIHLSSVENDNSIQIFLDDELKNVLPRKIGTYQILLDFNNLLSDETIYLSNSLNTNLFGAIQFNTPKRHYNGINMNLVTVYQTNQCDILITSFEISHWVKDQDRYLDKVYLDLKNKPISVEAYGRKLPTEEIDGKTFYVVDSSEVDSIHLLTLYLTIIYSKNSLYNKNTHELKYLAELSGNMYFNQINELNKFSFDLLLYRNSSMENKEILILGTLEALNEYQHVIVPSYFQSTYSLINQIIYIPQERLTNFTYRTNNFNNYISIGIRDSEIAYGSQRKEIYEYKGVTYKIIFMESAGDFAGYNIDFFDESSNLYYSIFVNTENYVDYKEVIHSLVRI